MSDDLNHGFVRNEHPWERIFVVGLRIHSLVRTLHHRKKNLLRFGARHLNQLHVFHIDQYLKGESLKEFRPAFSAAGHCHDLLFQATSAWQSVQQISAELEPTAMEKIQVTFEILNLILEDTAWDMIEILTGESVKVKAFRPPTQVEADQVDRIIAAARAENPPRELDPLLVRLSLIPVPPAQRRIARAISLGRNSLARAEKYCAHQLYEHAAQIMIKGKLIRTATEKRTVPQFPPELLDAVRNAVRYLGKYAKVNQIKKHLGRRSTNVGEVLAYLKENGEFHGVRG